MELNNFVKLLESMDRELEIAKNHITFVKNKIHYIKLFSEKEQIMTKKKGSTETKKAKGKKPKKPTLTYKEKLIEEAKKLIGVADVKANEFYYFVVRDHKLAFVTMNHMVEYDVQIMGIQGRKILRGLEEYHWDVYGNAFVFNIPPEQIECTEDSIDESATMPGNEKPELI